MKRILLLMQFAVLTAFGQTSTKQLSKRDYSFGLIEAKVIKREILLGHFNKVDNIIMKLSSDNLSQTMECLSLNVKESTLVNWYNQSENSEPSTLALGIFYGHQGWKIRGYGYSFDVNENNTLGFIDYQEKSRDLLNKITINKPLITEAKARLIRVYMSLGEAEKASSSFEDCIQIDSNNVWAYIHQSESIQPKWGGNPKLLTNFIEKLPKNRLIQQIITLKLTLDSFIWDENLFYDGKKDINQKAKNNIQEIDREIESNSTNSIHRFLIFGYITSISEEVENHLLLKKYYKKMNENYPLYPFGILE